MQRIDETCTESDCDKSLRVRDHGDPYAYPRTNQTSSPLKDPQDISQCVAITHSGERCPHYAGDTRVCGNHGDTLKEAARRGFQISVAAYAAAVHAYTDTNMRHDLREPSFGTPVDTRSPHVRAIKRVHPCGLEHECPDHGIVAAPL